MFVLLTFINQL